MGCWEGVECAADNYLRHQQWVFLSMAIFSGTSNGYSYQWQFSQAPAMGVSVYDNFLKHQQWVFLSSICFLVAFWKYCWYELLVCTLGKKLLVLLCCSGRYRYGHDVQSFQHCMTMPSKCHLPSSLLGTIDSSNSRKQLHRMAGLTKEVAQPRYFTSTAPSYWFKKKKSNVLEY
jgi:hypothetical protein